MIHEIGPVKLVRESGVVCRTFAVDSSNGTGRYYVHVFTVGRYKRTAVLCSCPHGFNLAPLSVNGLAMCKHAEQVAAELVKELLKAKKKPRL